MRRTRRRTTVILTSRAAPPQAAGRQKSKGIKGLSQNLSGAVAPIAPMLDQPL